jgi:hypothetical protein
MYGLKGLGSKPQFMKWQTELVAIDEPQGDGLSFGNRSSGHAHFVA